MHSTNYIHNAVLQSSSTWDGDHNGLVIAYVTRPGVPTPGTTPPGKAPEQVKMLIAHRGVDMPLGLGTNWGLMISEYGCMCGMTPLSWEYTEAGLPDWDSAADAREGLAQRAADPLSNGPFAWAGKTTAVQVTRKDNIITVKCSYFKDDLQTKLTDHESSPEWLSGETEIVLDLRSDPAFADFLVPTGYGYSNWSQEESYFNDSAAFSNRRPPVPINFDIYDFTQCKPKIWAYNLGQNIWNTYQSDDFDAKVAGDGVLVADKDGCGSYGFDCLGRCLTVSTTADCGPPPDPPDPPEYPPPDITTYGVYFSDSIGKLGAFYLDYWDLFGINKDTVSTPSDLFLPPANFEAAVYSIVGTERFIFPITVGLPVDVPGIDVDSDHQAFEGEYPTFDSLYASYKAIVDPIASYPLFSNGKLSPRGTGSGTIDNLFIGDLFDLEIYEGPNFTGKKVVYEGPGYLDKGMGGSTIPGPSASPHVIANHGPGRPGFNFMGVFLRQFKQYISTNPPEISNYFANSPLGINLTSPPLDASDWFPSLSPADRAAWYIRQMIIWANSVSDTEWDRFDAARHIAYVDHTTGTPPPRLDVTTHMESFKVIKK